MNGLETFLLADPRFSETIERLPISEEYTEIVRQRLPPSWSLVRKDIWVMCSHAEDRTPQQGFKIHVSGSIKSAKELLSLIVPVCERIGVAFKFAADPSILGIMSSKNYNRGASSKFFVIYPRDVDEFKSLLSELDGLTKHLSGAYILSDRRFGESRVLYYRYGGFLPAWKLEVDGSQTAVIATPDGKMVKDVRLPYYKLPDWVEEPFGDVREVSRQEGQLLGGRYEPVKALAFSNSGGVYEAVDRKTGDKVVLKEARPLTGLWPLGEGTYLDSVGILQNEYSILKCLDGLERVVSARELFREWEHIFLVEDFVEGIPLSSFRSRREGNMLPFTGEREVVETFCRNFRTISVTILEIVSAVHERGVILGDLSPTNLLINPQTFEIKLIDVESALAPTSPKGFEILSRIWSTPGFRETDKSIEEPLTERDDFFAVAMILSSLILPATPLTHLKGSDLEAIYSKIEACVGLPAAPRRAIQLLIDGEAEAAYELLRNWDVSSSLREAARPVAVWKKKRLAPRVLEEAVTELANFTVATADSTREDRLFPADSAVFRTHPLGLAYGAGGVALFLKTALGALPQDIEGWILSKASDPVETPPGLFPGAAGVAYALAQLGHLETAKEIFDTSRKSELLHAESNWFEGAAGWAWVSLFLGRLLGQERYSLWAREVGEKLLATSESETVGCSWKRNFSGDKPYGLAYGASGIALFLATLFEETGDPRFRDGALQGIEFEISQSLYLDGGIWWGRWEGDTLKTPYWLRGSGGIGSALVRLSAALDSEKYLEFAQRVAESAFSRFSVEPGQFEGLAGTGEFILDLFCATKNEKYLEQAYDIADSLLRFSVTCPEGLAMPGKFLLRLSTDYATGSAGVGLFLARLANPGPRLLHDLDAHCSLERSEALSA